MKDTAVARIYKKKKKKKEEKMSRSEPAYEIGVILMCDDGFEF